MHNKHDCFHTCFSIVSERCADYSVIITKMIVCDFFYGLCGNGLLIWVDLWTESHSVKDTLGTSEIISSHLETHRIMNFKGDLLEIKLSIRRSGHADPCLHVCQGQ